MANCQFKDLRENTLISDQTKETHARKLQTNPHGGPALIKNIKFAQFVFKHNLQQLVPVRQVHEINLPQKGLHKKKIILFKPDVDCDLQKTEQIFQK